MAVSRLLAALLLIPAIGGTSRAALYYTQGSHIVEELDGAATVWVAGGVNAFNQYGPQTLNRNGMRVIREVVNHFKSCPVAASEGARQIAGTWLHPLQSIVDRNRSDGKVTILAFFGWDETTTQVTGRYPSEQPFWTEYLARLGVIAAHFAGQQDVWINPWNEPFAGADIPIEDWVSDMTAMYAAIRNAGNNNIVVITGIDWAANTTPFLSEEGKAWLAARNNVVAAVHCYWSWMVAGKTSNIAALEAVRQAGWPLIVGECGPAYLSHPSDASNFLDACIELNVTTLAWSWSSSDGLNLVESGNPSVDTGWGGVFFPYMASLQGGWPVPPPEGDDGGQLASRRCGGGPGLRPAMLAACLVLSAILHGKRSAVKMRRRRLQQPTLPTASRQRIFSLATCGEPPRLGVLFPCGAD